MLAYLLGHLPDPLIGDDLLAGKDREQEVHDHTETHNDDEGRAVEHEGSVGDEGLELLYGVVGGAGEKGRQEQEVDILQGDQELELYVGNWVEPYESEHVV